MYVCMYQYHSLNLLKRMLVTSEPQGIVGDLVTRGDISRRETRSADQYVTPPIRSEAGRRRFKYSLVNECNALPPTIRSLSTRGFKKELKQHLLRKQRGGVG